MLFDVFIASVFLIVGFSIKPFDWYRFETLPLFFIQLISAYEGIGCVSHYFLFIWSICYVAVIVCIQGHSHGGSDGGEARLCSLCQVCEIVVTDDNGSNCCTSVAFQTFPNPLFIMEGAPVPTHTPSLEAPLPAPWHNSDYDLV